MPPLSESLRRIYDGAAPQTADDLRQMDAHQQALAEKLLAATVSVQLGPAFGSGVIVSEDGLVLTAAHVASEPGRRALIRLANGKRLYGKSLGVHRPLDAGMLKIDDDVDVPFLKLANTLRLEEGQWCAASGHPGGFDADRGAVFRVGRILDVGALIRTDCQLAGGDSGGPLVNMQGEVIGIHSRIGISLSNNLHAPATSFVENWEGLLAGDIWRGSAYLGVVADQRTTNAIVGEVTAGSPAARAGISAGDIITRFAGQKVHSFRELVNVVQLRRPGEWVEVELTRGDQTLTLDVKVGRRDRQRTVQENS